MARNRRSGGRKAQAGNSARRTRSGTAASGAHARSVETNALQFMTGRDLIGRGSSNAYTADDPLRQLPVWHTGVSVAGEALISPPFQLWAVDRDGERQRQILPRDPKNSTAEEFLARLFQRPNDAQSWPELLEMLNQHHYGKKGAAYIRLRDPDRATRVPLALELIQPEEIEAVPEPGNRYKLKEWSLTKTATTLPAEAVAMVKWSGDPKDPWRAIGPEVPARTTLDMDRMARLYMTGTLAGGGVPVGVANYEGEDAGEIDPKERDRFETDLIENYGRPGGKRWLVTMGGWTIQNPGFRPRDMEYGQVVKWVVEDTARIQKIPPLYLAHFEGVSSLNGAGLAVQELLLYRMNTIPRIRRLEPVLNERIIQIAAPNVVGVFDLSAIDALQEGVGEKLDHAAKLQALGVPFAQINEQFDLGVSIEEMPWAHEWFVPAGLIPARDMVGEGLGEPAAQVTEVTEVASEPRVDLVQVVDIVAKVESGALPRDSGLGLLALAGLTPEQASAAMGSAGLEPEPVAEPVSSPLPAEPAPEPPAPEPKRTLIRRASTTRITTAKQRQAARVAFVRAHTKIELEMARAVRRVRREQRDAVLAGLMGTARRAEPELVDLSPEEIDRILAQIKSGITASAIGPAVAKAARTGAVLLFDVLEAMSIPHDSLLDFQRNRLPRIVDAWRDARMSNPLVNEVDDKLRARVNEAIVTAMADGKGMAEIVDAVRVVFNNATIHRARTIARTETAIAMNNARFELMRDQGVERHEWMSQEDELVRESHAAVNGEIVVVGEPFSNGLVVPGDPAAPAEEIIECRCGTAPVSRSDFEEGRALWRPHYWDALVREELAA